MQDFTIRRCHLFIIKWIAKNAELFVKLSVSFENFLMTK